MIYYFSCTGNTAWAARQIGEMLNERLANIADVLQGKECPSDLSDDEPLGFCFPVHGWRPPLPVRKFMQSLHGKGSSSSSQKRRYCWMLCTAGDDIGETVEIAEKDLSASGLSFDSAFSLIMPESYVGLPFMDVDNADNEARKLSQAEKDLKRYSDIIRQRQTDVRLLHTSHWPKTNSRLLGWAFVRWLLTDKPFHVVEDRCIGCGLCVRSCPMANVVQDDDKHPQWMHDGRCISCFACYHHCPSHAIEYGGRTRHKGQYHHP